MEAADEYKGFLDKSFDQSLQTLELPWLPWVGSTYRGTQVKTIVLGESVYIWESKDRVKTEARIRSEDGLRKLHLSKGLADAYPHGRAAYLANFERTALRKAQVPGKERQKLWSELAYLNLVLRPMKTSKHRPTEKDYAEGWPSFFQVARVLEASRCIVYGLEKPKLAAFRGVPGLTVLEEARFPEVGSGKTAVRPFRVRVSIGGREIEFFFIRHPSAFYSWRKWANWLQSVGVDLVASGGLQS